MDADSTSAENCGSAAVCEWTNMRKWSNAIVRSMSSAFGRSPAQADSALCRPDDSQGARPQLSSASAVGIGSRRHPPAALSGFGVRADRLSLSSAFDSLPVDTGERLLGYAGS